MRCSLLTLSSYVDSELDDEHRGELEGHLVGCNRCSTALTYLREETERVASLTTVHVDDYAADELFALIGIRDEREQWDDEGPKEPRQPPWLEAAQARVLDMPQQEYEDAGLSAHEADMQPSDVPPPEPPPLPEPPPIPFVAPLAPVGLPPFDSSDYVPAAAPVEYPAEPETRAVPEPDVPVPAEQPVPHVRLADTHVEPVHLEPVHVEPAHVEPSHVEPVHVPAAAAAAAMPQRAGGGSLGRIFNRMRDAVGVRMALRRTAPEYDDSVQIVSGRGAPSWEGRPSHRGYQDRMERRRPEPVASAADVEEEREATGYAVRHSAVREPVYAGAVSGAAVMHEPVEPAAPHGGEPPQFHDAESGPSLAGRHMRSVVRNQGNGNRFSGLGALTAAVARRTGARHGPVAGVSRADRRLWIFGAATVILLLIGVLLGKSSTPVTQPVTAPPQTHPSVAPSLAPPSSAATPIPSAAPTTAPSSAPTATPAPTPSVPQLTSVVKLGNGGTNVQILDVRYGVHTTFYRVVFDLSSGNGDPNVTMGFVSPTKFYVEFSGTSSSPPPGSPEAGLVVSAQLLNPSPVSGETVYEFTLKKNADYIANYIPGPRLTIDFK